MGKYDNIWSEFEIAADGAYRGTPETLIQRAIANELAEANRIALLAIKLEVEKQKSSVLDKENKRNVDLFIYKKDLEDQA